MNRRTAIGAIGAMALGTAAPSQVKRTAPMLCMFSQNAIRVPYPELGNIAQQIGYEGVDLTVMIGGHVDPRVMNVDLMRSFESIHGASLEIPIITTNITALGDSTVYPVLYVSGKAGVSMFRTGFWPYGPAPIQERLRQVRQELASVVSLAQRCGIAAAIPNRAGDFVGEATWDTYEILTGMDPRWAGHYFDPSQAVAEGGLGGWEAAFRLALPRLKAIALQDFYWQKAGAEWKMQMCPLGEGMVDWKKFFTMAAAASFTGPFSLHMEYKTVDEPGAMAKDLEFARKYVEQAWAHPPA